MNRPHRKSSVSTHTHNSSRKKSKRDHPFRTLLKLSEFKNGKPFRQLGEEALRLLFAYIVHVNQKTGRCWPKTETISKITGIDYRHITRARAQLVAAGLLVIIRKGTRTKSAIVEIPLLLTNTPTGDCDSTNTPGGVRTNTPTGDITIKYGTKQLKPNPQPKTGGEEVSSFSSSREFEPDLKFPTTYHSAITAVFKQVGVKSPYLIKKFIREHALLAPLYAIQLLRQWEKTSERKKFGTTAAGYLLDPFGKKLEDQDEDMTLGRPLDPDLEQYRTGLGDYFIGEGEFLYKRDRALGDKVRREDYPDDDLDMLAPVD